MAVWPAADPPDPVAAEPAEPVAALPLPDAGAVAPAPAPAPPPPTPWARVETEMPARRPATNSVNCDLLRGHGVNSLLSNHNPAGSGSVPDGIPFAAPASLARPFRVCTRAARRSRCRQGAHKLKLTNRKVSSAAVPMMPMAKSAPIGALSALRTVHFPVKSIWYRVLPVWCAVRGFRGTHAAQETFFLGGVTSDLTTRRESKCGKLMLRRVRGWLCLPETAAILHRSRPTRRPA